MFTDVNIFITNCVTGIENASTENASTMQTFSQIKKSLVLHKLVWCIFKWGGQENQYQHYHLRQRLHNKALIPKTTYLSDRDYIMRMLYKNCY